MNNISLNLVIAIIIFIIGSISIAVARAKFKAIIAFALVLIYGAASSFPAIQALKGIPFEAVIRGSRIFGNIPIRIDALSAWFILIINFTILTGGLYGINYMKAYKEQKSNLSLHWILFIVFHLSMLSVCVIQNGFAFLIAWEVMSLSSMLLVIFEHYKPETLRSGLNYLVQMHLSAVLLTLGVIGLFIQTNSFDFASASQISDAAVLPLFTLFFGGFAFKAGFNIGFIPLHTWLPHAHPAAPSHISGIMSGAMIKLGIYGILRMIGVFPLEAGNNYLLIGWILLGISVASGLYGVMLAIVQHNLKKLLAYHSIENIGIIGMGIGLGCIGLGMKNPYIASTGFISALLHTLNHSLFKSMLFYAAGNVYLATHTLNLESLGGLFKKIPQTALLFLLAALAICGLPPFNGFISEFILYSGLYHGAIHSSTVASVLLILAILVLVLIGGLAILCFTKAFSVVFLGTGRRPVKQNGADESFVNTLPMYFTGVLILAIGLFPSAFVSLLSGPVSLFIPGFSFGPAASDSSLFITLQHVSRASAGLIALSAVVLSVRYFVTSKKPQAVSPTWGCGYVGESVKMQYTANSFVRMYRKLASPILSVRRIPVEINEIFPKENNRYETHPEDALETNLIDKPLSWMHHFFSVFQFLQNGKIHYYLLYGIVFMLAIGLLTWLNII